ncbi:MAG TPA: FAD-binding oxidoreductase [Acidobacteriaceae bacterium]|nr:FAD-binding oxidoreductase [Acidobacteriaceae bacterium]
MQRVSSRFEELASVAGPDIVSERDGRLVTSPRTTEEIAAVLRYADATGAGVEIAGAGTKRGWAGAVHGGVLLDMRGLTGVCEHSWQDLTATVRAGTTWGEMQRALAAYGQMVALDPLWADRATVGGVIATNDSGALRFRYGGLRDLVIGMTMVLADGTIARSGGKVVKNVAGYDLHKLMIGAFGTLAVVTEVTFRLHAIPRNTRVWSFGSADANACGEVLMKVMDSQLSVQAMQLRASAAGFSLDVELASIDEVLREQWSFLNSCAGGEGAISGDAFGARERLFAGDGVVMKVTMLPSAIARSSAEIVRLGGEAVTQATGIMVARLADASGVERLREFVAAEGEGAVTVLRGADGVGVLPSAGNSAVVMREIKRRFDGNGILNPGVVVGG